MKADRLIDFHGVREMVPFGRRTIDQWEQDGKFPKRINFGSSCRWSFREVAAWVEARKSEREVSA